MWKEIENQPPAEGKIVNTKISDHSGERNEQTLVKQGNLWFTPDHKMYVYYTPTHWEDKENDS